jgi:hypothetical protein
MTRNGRWDSPYSPRSQGDMQAVPPNFRNSSMVKLSSKNKEALKRFAGYAAHVTHIPREVGQSSRGTVSCRSVK